MELFFAVASTGRRVFDMSSKHYKKTHGPLLPASD